jgi:hypothetical protein
MAAWRRLGKEAGMGAELTRLIAERTGGILSCAGALVATARTEGCHRPVIDRVFALMRKRSGQLEA